MKATIIEFSRFETEDDQGVTRRIFPQRVRGLLVEEGCRRVLLAQVEPGALRLVLHEETQQRNYFSPISGVIVGNVFSLQDCRELGTADLSEEVLRMIFDEPARRDRWQSLKDTIVNKLLTAPSSKT